MFETNNKNQAIWLFAGGDMQEMAAKKILESGFKLILTDANPNCVCAKHAAEFVSCSTFDIQCNLKAAEELRKKYDIKAALTVGADCHEAVANAAKFLNIHGVDPKISHICREKFLAREILEKAGIPQPKFRKAATLDEAKKAIAEIGLPVVIKSSDNSGSRGFSKIENLEELTQESLNLAIENGTTGYAIIEELLLPLEDEIAEQSLETVWYDGRMYWLNWVDRLFRKDFLLFKNLDKDIYSNVSWSVELGHINPALHDFETQQKVFEMVYKAGLALGLGSQKGGHIMKVDMMLTKKGPYILEPTLRLSGGWDSAYTTPQRGADFIGGAIRLALGEKLDLDMWIKYFQYKNANLFSSMLTIIPENAKDCLGRKFSHGASFNREESLKKAYENLTAGTYVSNYYGGYFKKDSTKVESAKKVENN